MFYTLCMVMETESNLEIRNNKYKCNYVLCEKLHFTHIKVSSCRVLVRV